MFPLQALIGDSGAEDNLIDEVLVRQLGCALDPLDKPIPGLALDGKAFTEVTQKTVPVSLVIYSNHHTSIYFLLISLPQTPLFGIPLVKDP